MGGSGDVWTGPETLGEVNRAGRSAVKLFARGYGGPPVMLLPSGPAPTLPTPERSAVRNPRHDAPAHSDGRGGPAGRPKTRIAGDAWREAMRWMSC